MTVAAIQAVAAFQLEPLADRDLFDGGPWNAELGDEVFAQHAHAAARDGAHRQFRMTRNAELADEKHVERRMQSFRDLESDRHPTPRQREHDDVMAIRVLRQRVGELPSRFDPIFETHV